MLERIGQDEGLPVPTLTPAALAMFQIHDWPGNCRELSNVLTMAVIQGCGDLNTAQTLQFFIEPAARLDTSGHAGADFER